MAYKVIILYQLYMPSYFLGTFTEYPWRDFQIIPVGWVKSCHTIRAQRPYLVIGWSTAKDGQLLTGPDKKAYLPPKESLFNRMVVSI